ncbi:uncharacterized protein Z520_11262 [Fonsecaea multimorphosa CBS 102226]|uniref:Glucose-methanol-choline oxidoreductase N-terminal domain-containing protein n=1 Tax=Fonsecaea multimorphosa CBS 102226 TaxID=1442371 RepID=A0A0D2JRA4_9EURO|nr:uncharacterized protein Z520_11262 [Fonsecaea multimorphosa CBS 102226]KIX92989.1 hypothetical protein Z520_11262 [Fonsecaea multimorphosa CBS 102226]OAL18237.1 hypothetical protein AYO22_10815 [Fonsecaea multimorphosa]
MPAPGLREEYDIVVAGGGTAACVLAGRLQMADPALSILIIEEGRDNYEDPTVRTPALFLAHMAPDSTSAVFLPSKPTEQVGGRPLIIPRAAILGGASSINFMMYCRAQAVDFDEWKAEGWTHKDMIPLLKRLETYHAGTTKADERVHGTSGPISVSLGSWPKTAYSCQFLRAAAACGMPSRDDLQDLETAVGFERMHKFISPEGVRQDAAHTYLHPLLHDGAHPNLKVLLHTKVSRVLFDDQNRATGIEYISSAPWNAGSPTTPTLGAVRAKKLVVVCAGALASPAILERSGIGGRAHLEKLGIQVISELPGVGERYQDHPFIHYAYKSSLPEHETLDWFLRNPAKIPELMAQTNLVLGTNGLEIFGRWRPSISDVKKISNPAMTKIWQEEFEPHPSKPLMLTGSFAGYLGPPTDVPPGQYFTIGNYIPYPHSRGSVHITAKDADAPLEISTGFFEGPGDVDLDVHVWAYKRTREIARRLDCYRGETPVGHPNFAPSSRAALATLDNSATEEAAKHGKQLEDLEYSAEDDEAIKVCIRERIATAWHYLGSAQMRPREQGGVVDKDLNVYGVSKLKVAGMAFSPSLSFRDSSKPWNLCIFGTVNLIQG